MTAGTVTDWLRDEGSEISEGDPLLTVETEKAVNDVEAPADGILLRIVAGQGTEVPVSAAVAIIAAPGEELTDAEIAALIESAAPKKAGATAKKEVAVGGREGRAAARDASGRVNASPAARKLASVLGIDLAEVEATGPGGRITSDDVERAAAERDEDPSPVEKQVALADGREINALVAGPGNGPKIVFLHGLGGSQSTWQVALGDLVERYRVAAIDLPGHGASAKSEPASTDYSVEGLAAAIAEAIVTLNAGPAIVAGHSLGGAIALQIALSKPELVQGVVLINSAGLGDEIGAELTELMSGGPGKETARGLLELFYKDQRLVLDRGIDEMAETQVAEGAWAAQQAVANGAFSGSSQQIEVRGKLADIKQPVMIVWGAKDRVIPLAHAVDALQSLPDATLRVLPNVGHVPQVEDAPAVATAIDRFAKSLA
jgi:pyruvate dehydrogenase E2 component (dihydrolipoamide acetyltransferase)